MSRSVGEWIGKTDDTPVPPHVRLRVLLKADKKCAECGTEIDGTKRWICDHRIAIINGGENRESNLGPIHDACDKTKTAADVALKSTVYRKAARNYGIVLRKGPAIKGAGFRKSPPQNSASRPISRKSERNTFEKRP